MIDKLDEYGVALTSKARLFAVEKHKGQKYGDNDYVHHLQGVVRNVVKRNADNPLLAILIAIAWLHDVLEDCDVTLQELINEFGVCIAFSVQDLSKTKGQDYKEYMLQCCKTALAREVKICDTLFNLNESFFSGNVKGMNKYPTQLAILQMGHWAEELLFYKEKEDE